MPVRRPFGAPVVAQRLADRAVVGIAREVEDERAILLEAVGEVELEEGVGLDDARLVAVPSRGTSRISVGSPPSQWSAPSKLLQARAGISAATPGSARDRTRR